MESRAKRARRSKSKIESLAPAGHGIAFSLLMVAFGTRAKLSCFTISSPSRSHEAVQRISLEEAPILTVYLPTSAAQLEEAGSK
jgi:hypothetical protein